MAVNIIEKLHSLIESEIRKQRYGSRPQSLYEPIHYLMSIGGKRLRPMLVLLAYSLYKKDVRAVAPYAVAVEAFHNFTLMHDDIMDKAPLRRGKETVHKKWNVNTAILSGDVMLVKVYEMFSSLDAEKFKVVMERFNQCAAEVCEGQQWDMEFERASDVTEKDYINMIRLKTAVLLGFSLELGAILADAPQQDRDLLREFGTNIGVGFQLRDDLLDAYADPRKFGKQVGGDIIANKKTYLLIQAITRSSAAQKKELEYWLGVTKFKKKEKVAAVKAIYDSVGIPKLTEKKVNHFFDRGFSSLKALSVADESRQLLRSFTEALIERQS